MPKLGLQLKLASLFLAGIEFWGSLEATKSYAVSFCSQFLQKLILLVANSNYVSFMKRQNNTYILVRIAL